MKCCATQQEHRSCLRLSRVKLHIVISPQVWGSIDGSIGFELDSETNKQATALRDSWSPGGLDSLVNWGQWTRAGAGAGEDLFPANEVRFGIGQRARAHCGCNGAKEQTMGIINCSIN
jgi:hypothetical protein